MGKSRIKDWWLRKEWRRINLENGERNLNKDIEMSRKHVGSFIEKRLRDSAYYLEEHISGGGHKRRSYGTSMMNGILRMILKEEARREIDEEMRNE